MIDRRLQHVVATARFGSFTAAAERAGVTQSAITKSVADLERQLGYSIFNRTARGILMTAEGRVFVERASRLLDEAQDMLRGASQTSDPFAGVLRIGVCPASLEWLLAEPLAKLNRQHPTIRLEIVGDSFDKILEQLRSGGVDVALGYDAAFKEQPDLRREAMQPLRTTFFARHGHPILNCGAVTPAQIAKYAIVSPSASLPYENVWRQLYAELGFDAQDRMHIIDYFPIVERIVANTDAISLVAIPYTHTGIFKKRFVTLDLIETLPAAPICCAMRLRGTPRPAVRAFIEACRELIPSSNTDAAI
jgi:DNA-binding transcriptional LysR family regulator